MLDPRTREQLVIYLHDCEHLTFKAIGEEMGFNDTRSHDLYKRGKAHENDPTVVTQSQRD